MKVIDGDTVIIEENKFKWGRNDVQLIKCRLLYIDAPENDQMSFDDIPIGKNATRYLSKLIEGKKIVVQFYGKDIYQRQLVRIWTISGEDVNYLLLKEGLALISPLAKFSSLQEKYNYLISYSRAVTKRKGIWSTEGFLSPYIFRKRKKLLKALSRKSEN